MEILELEQDSVEATVFGPIPRRQPCSLP